VACVRWKNCHLLAKRGSEVSEYLRNVTLTDRRSGTGKRHAIANLFLMVGVQRNTEAYAALPVAASFPNAMNAAQSS